MDRNQSQNQDQETYSYDDELGADDGGGETAQQAAGDHGDQEERRLSPDVEAKARQRGWVPFEDWEGPEAAWTDAEEYLNRGDPRYLRSLVDRQDRELRDLRAQRQQDAQNFDARLKRLDKLNETSMARQKKMLLAQIEASQRQAAADGDLDAYDELNEQRSAVDAQFAAQEAEIAKQTAIPAQQGGQPPDPELMKWTRANPAVQYNENKWQAAVNFYSEAEDELGADASQGDKMAFVTERLNEAFGQGTARMPGRGHRTNVRNGAGQQRARAPQMEGGSRMAIQQRQPNQKGWNDIPLEDRKILQRHIDEGLYDPDPSKPDRKAAMAAATNAYWS